MIKIERFGLTEKDLITLLNMQFPDCKDLLNDAKLSLGIDPFSCLTLYTGDGGIDLDKDDCINLSKLFSKLSEFFTEKEL